VKLSSLTPPTQYPHRSLAPVVKRLAEAYGPARLMWGGGFGPESTPESYGAEQDRVRALLGFMTREDQDQVLGGTAARILRFA
jgi:predicted TIM-barrel fold metal-dependent hydrolase